MKSIGEIMTREVKSLRDDQTLLAAMQFMREHKVRHIPVLSDDGAVRTFHVLPDTTPSGEGRRPSARRSRTKFLVTAR